jgi:glycine cleavage system H protein
MYPDDLKYAQTHEWVRSGDPATIGISQFAQEELGDLVYVDLPKVGRTLTAGEGFGSVESVKTVSDVYAPAAGEVVEVNEALSSAPETVNSDPYGEGWLIKLKLSNTADLDGLMDAAAYEKNVGPGH